MRPTKIAENGVCMLQQRSSIDSSSARSTGLLIIEDDETLRRVLVRAFSKFGIRLWSVANGLEGVQTFHQKSDEIDLVLSDIQMPLLDGLATLQMLRRLNANVRCCLMTGDGSERSIAQAAALSPYRLFVKPFDMMDVVSLLADIGAGKAVSQNYFD